MDWKTVKGYDSEYLGSADIGATDREVTIKVIKEELATFDKGRKENKLIAYFEEANKPMVLNKTNLKTLTKLFKTRETSQYHGKKILLYVDNNVAFRGETVDGLRIREYLPRVTELKCESCGNKIDAFDKMNASQLAEYTRRKYGMALCSTCASAKAKEVEA